MAFLYAKKVKEEQVNLYSTFTVASVNHINSVITNKGDELWNRDH